MGHFRKEHLILIAIIITAIFLRLPQINHPFTTEESEWYFGAKTLTKEFTLVNINQPSPIFNYPIAMGTYRLIGLTFGATTFNLRLSALIFGIVNILLAFVLGRKLLGEKAALFAAGLMAIMPWHLFESVIIEHDGSFLMFFYLITFISFLKFEETNKKRWFVLSVTSFILALLTKSSAILIPAILMLYLFLTNPLTKISWNELKKRNLKNAIFKFFNSLLKPLKYGSIMIISGILILLLFFFLIKTNAPLYYNALIYRMFEAKQMAGGFGIGSVSRVMMYLILWASPLILGLTIIGLKNLNRNKVLLSCWLIIPVAAYSTSGYAGGIDRYMSVIIPAMCLLAGESLSKIKWNNKIKIWFAGISILSFFVFTWLGTLPAEYLTHNISEYIKRAALLKWNFLFPFYGSSGPAFLISFIVLGAGISLSLMLLFSSLIWKNRNILLIAFLAVSFALNAVILQEFMFSTYHPDIYAVTEKLANDYKTENLGNSPIYISTSGLSILLQRFDNNVTLLNGEYTENDFNLLKTKLRSERASILLVDFPKMDDDTPQKRIVANCTLINTVEDKGIKLGFDYKC